MENDLNQIVRNGQGKRAIEVALAGDHSVGFVGHLNAFRLNEFANRIGLKSHYTTQCPCGFWEYQTWNCQCPIEDIKLWEKNNNFIATVTSDIVIFTDENLPQFAIENWRPEKEEQLSNITNRIARNRQDISDEVDDSGLLDAAIKNSRILEAYRPVIIAVAKTVAEISSWDSKGKITQAAVAEAITYRPRSTQFLISDEEIAELYLPLLTK